MAHPRFEAATRGLPNFRRTPEALSQLASPSSRALLKGLGILSEVELESRYHVRVERYVKDMLIELHTLAQVVDTLVVPAGMTYLNQLAAGAADAKAAGISAVPQVALADRVGALVAELFARREHLQAVIDRADAMHGDPSECAALLTSEGADAMAAVRESADALELIVSDDLWPLPKYREMLFPV